MASSVPIYHGQVRPLQARFVRSSGRSRVAVPSVSAPDRLLSYRNYDDQKLVSAVEAVQRGMSIRRACEEYGVPKSTLHDKVSGKTGLNAKSGSQSKLLSDEEESRLTAFLCECAAFLCECAAIGYVKSRKDVLAIAQQIVN